jgi:hypothetical protein
MTIYFDDTRFTDAAYRALTNAGAEPMIVLYARDLWGGGGDTQDPESPQFTDPFNLRLIEQAVNRDQAARRILIDWEPGPDARRLSTEAETRYPWQTFDRLIFRRRFLYQIAKNIADRDVEVSFWIGPGSAWDGNPTEPLGNLSEIELDRLRYIREMDANSNDFITGAEYSAVQRFTSRNRGNLDNWRLLGRIWVYLAWLRAAIDVAAPGKRAAIFVTPHHLERLEGRERPFERQEQLLVEMLRMIQDFGFDAALWRYGNEAGLLAFNDRENERLARIVTEVSKPEKSLLFRKAAAFQTDIEQLFDVRDEFIRLGKF